jgi:hypothetical protein
MRGLTAFKFSVVTALLLLSISGSDATAQSTYGHNYFPYNNSWFDNGLTTGAFITPGNQWRVALSIVNAYNPPGTGAWTTCGGDFSSPYSGMSAVSYINNNKSSSIVLCADGSYLAVWTAVANGAVIFSKSGTQWINNGNIGFVYPHFYGTRSVVYLYNKQGQYVGYSYYSGNGNGAFDLAASIISGGTGIAVRCDGSTCVIGNK